ncbi:DUF5316 domain-containing protein [Metasolibacillus meyeri]|uniref:DUF5316 domain-containing protein n=1 Tax=Metasolibacillus meyeri TaxID=1071052 RepID=A0AAW9NRC5_9BACL|nr:DUF5316 domain-containing protein [Metasolibacillus meyeri]MEC1180137.1 DUF5316 domain-containing protein [Metasolibacillus meyeri]
MKKYILYGIVLAVGAIVAALILGDIHKTSQIAAGIGGALLILTMLFSGVFVNGDRLRANLATESKEQRERRYKYEEKFLLMSIPCFAVAILFYWLF